MSQSADPAEALKPEMAIVVPVYNGSLTLQAALEALLGAPGPSREIVVVDDGSCDGSAEIAEALGVRTLRQPNIGDSAARNRGADETAAPLIVFVDADVVIRADALERISTFMLENRDYAAVFGSYDAEPSAPGFVSQYRNLLHHLNHQQGNPEAETFWTGLGAVRRSAFKHAGTFQSDCDPIADVALGLTLRDAGQRIRLDRELLGTHLKAWTLKTVVTTDIVFRAIPWTKLILSRGRFTNGLGTSLIDRFGVASAMAAVASAILALVIPAFALLAALCLLANLGANANVFAQFWKERGAQFTLGAVPLQFVHQLCAGVGFILALMRRLSRTAPAPQGPRLREQPASIASAALAQEAIGRT